MRIQPKGAASTSGTSGPDEPHVMRWIAPSPPVTLVLTWIQSPTQFELPKLTVVFDKIVVKDDSDDLSAGDLAFGFWVYNQGPDVHMAQVDSGDSTYPPVSFTIENSPAWVGVRVYGFDNDEPEWILTPGGIIMSVLPTCGGIASPSDECPGDAAEGMCLINTGMSTGIAKPETPFIIYANGPKLSFQVEGRFWLSPY